jgi:hypothetical protein
MALGQQTPQSNSLNAYQAPQQLAPVYVAPFQDMIQQQMPAVQSPNSVRPANPVTTSTGYAHPFAPVLRAKQQLER